MSFLKSSLQQVCFYCEQEWSVVQRCDFLNRAYDDHQCDRRKQPHPCGSGNDLNLFATLGVKENEAVALCRRDGPEFIR
jgi:hypothetical protein